MALPDEYDSVVERVEKTKVTREARQQQGLHLDGLPEEWRARIEDQITAFATVENELLAAHRQWMIENEFDPDVKFGGWDPLEHQRFMLCGDANWKVEFADKPMEELHRHRRYVIRTQFLSRKIETMKGELQKRVEELRDEAAKDIREKEVKAANDLIAEERRRALAEEKDELNSRLQIERKEKQDREAAAAALAEDERQQKLAEERKLRELEDQQRSELKKRILSERGRKEQQEKEWQEKRRQAEEKERALLKLRMKDAKQHASERRQIQEEKQKAKIESDLKVAEELAERKRRLDQLAQTVRDEFGLDSLEADPTKLTKIQQMRRDMEPDPKPLWVATSFASHVIEADPRIRVENALREAGLMESAYASQVMRQMSALRPNQGMESRVFFG
jgi:hypothetical protein